MRLSVASVWSYKSKTVSFLHGGHFDVKDFLIKQGVSGHVMQLYTIFKMKFEDLLIRISLNLLNLGYL